MSKPIKFKATDIDGSSPSVRAGGYYDQHFKLNEVFKQLVAAAVVKEKLVKDGDAVVLDAGSSATYVAEVIFSTELKNLSILTHNMDVFQKYFSKTFEGARHQLLLTGGLFDESYNALYGTLTEKAYEVFHPNVVILAVSGLTASTNPASYSGVYCHAVVETRIKELLFSWPAERRIIIADYSKIGKVDSHMFGDFSKMKSKLEPLGRGYVVTTKPPKNAKSEEIKVFRDTIATLREWKIEVIEVD
jgi:DeoR/GlpR family transcriptional regulator of sugar metabolism